MSRKLPRLIAACCLVILAVPISVFAEEIWQNFDDGVVRVVVRDLLPGQAGKPGLFTEAHAVFDSFHAVRNN